MIRPIPTLIAISVNLHNCLSAKIYVSNKLAVTLIHRTQPVGSLIAKFPRHIYSHTRMAAYLLALTRYQIEVKVLITYRFAFSPKLVNFLTLRAHYFFADFAVVVSDNLLSKWALLASSTHADKRVAVT